jgi:glucosamine-6-phosphate deaminase
MPDHSQYELQRDRLQVRVFPDRRSMGMAAGAVAAARLRSVLAVSRRARVMFAAAPSQHEMLAALTLAPDVDWARVDAFHLDEYVGLARGDEHSFGDWLDRHIFDRVKPGRVEKLDPSAADPDAECQRYGRLLADGGVDIAFLGIGENGHVAFNEPHEADFDDQNVVKVVRLDGLSRQQQVHDGTFATVDAVPVLAMTVTMSTVLASRVIIVTVPGPAKAAAVARALAGPADTARPASALRWHPDATLFIDMDAAAGIATK